MKDCLQTIALVVISAGRARYVAKTGSDHGDLFNRVGLVECVSA
jgi:hypothetical protein